VSKYYQEMFKAYFSYKRRKEKETWKAEREREEANKKKEFVQKKALFEERKRRAKRKEEAKAENWEFRNAREALRQLQQKW